MATNSPAISYNYKYINPDNTNINAIKIIDLSTKPPKRKGKKKTKRKTRRQIMAIWWKPFVFLPLLFVCALSAPATGKRHSGAGLIIAYENTPFVDKPAGTQQTEANKNVAILTMPKVPNEETSFLGEWKLDNENAGVSAMQLQLMPTGKVVWYDTTSLGPSGTLNNPSFCLKKADNSQDCHAHAIEYDPQTSTYKTLKMIYDPLSTSGGLASNGDLVSVGGSNSKNNVDSQKAIRILSPTSTEFSEKLVALADKRQYSSMVKLEDGSFIVVGGRNAFTYEFVPSSSQLSFQQKLFKLPFLMETNTPSLENNLYPFLHLLPDGNVFVFANSKSIILDPKTAKVVRKLPDLPGGSRNYPSSGMSALLPLDLSKKAVEAEVMVCGGSSSSPKGLSPALNDCNRLVVTNPNAKWEKEIMPSPRVMGDLLILPNGELLMINGAKKGSSSWEAADEPNLTPVIYSPEKPKGQRFKELAPTKTARMYHSSSAVLPTGQILTAGSNPHRNYNFTSKYPTELKVERFSPPYLSPDFHKIRPVIAKANTRTMEIKYGQPFEEHIRLKVKTLDASEIKVTLYAPPFTTNGFSMNQRLVSLGLTKVSQDNIKGMAPASPKVAPPGKYLLFVVYRGIPSWLGRWVDLS